MGKQMKLSNIYGVKFASRDAIKCVATFGEADLQTMMKDKRYWDANMRDDNFVKQVEDGFKKLYG